MKQFKPSMKDGFGKEVGLAPEAHKEWKDSVGKHSVQMGMISDGGSPAKKVGPDGFDPGKDLKKHESVVKSKWANENKYRSSHDSDGAAKTGKKTGPMTKAGKGAEGAIKGFAGANKKGVGGAGR